MCRWIAPGVVGLLSCAALIGGCSGMPQLGVPVASFGASNVFSPTGYSEEKLDDTHFQVRATGTEATPKERVEKIARARAAQIGVEESLKYFKVVTVQYGVSCEKRKAGYKSEATPPASRPTVVLDVVYAKDTADPTFAASAETFEVLISELANEIVAPEAKAVAVQETRTSCGRG
jgi:hypothetical protein